MSIYLIALTTFVLFLSTHVGVPVLPALSASLGADATRMAAILSSTSMTIVLLQFFTGILADRWGKRAVLVGGAALGGLSSLLCAVAPSWQSLLLLRILGGVADAITMPALLGLTAEIAEGRQGAFFGVLRSSQGLSFIVAPVIGGWLAFYSLRTPFLVDGLLSFVAGLTFLLYVREKKGGRSGHGLEQLRHLGTLLQDRRIYAFILFGLADTFTFPVISAFLPTKAQGLGYAPWQISAMLTCEAIGFTVACALVGPLSDRWGRRPFVILPQPCIIAACLGLAFSRNLAALIAFYTLFGLGGASTFLMSTAMMADITPAESAATRLGAFDALMDLGIFVGPALALTLHRLVGAIDPILILAALPALAAWPAALIIQDTLVRRKRTVTAQGE